MGRFLTVFGLVGLLIVMAIALVLTARAWRDVAPYAIEVTNPPPADAAPPAAADRPEPVQGAGRLPSLNEMRQNTREHGRQIEELQDQIDP